MGAYSLLYFSKLICEHFIDSSWYSSWCGREDSNLHRIAPTSPSSWRVYHSATTAYTVFSWHITMKLMERVKRIELSQSAWKAEVLPLNYTRLLWSGRQDSNLRPPGPKPGALPSWATSRFMARPRGVEPLTFWSVVKRSIQLSYGRY